MGEDLEGAIRRATKLLTCRGKYDAKYRENGDEISSTYALEIAGNGEGRVRLELRENLLLRVWERDTLVFDAARIHPGEDGYGEPVRVDGHTYRVAKHVRGAWRDLLDETYAREFKKPVSSRASWAPGAPLFVSRTARDS